MQNCKSDIWTKLSGELGNFVQMTLLQILKYRFDERFSKPFVIA